jgi:hypothetical protein
MHQHQSKHASLLIRNEFFVRFLTIFLFLLSFFLLVHALLHTLSTVLSSAPGGDMRIEPIHREFLHPTQAGVGLVSSNLWVNPSPASKVVSLDDSFKKRGPH